MAISADVISELKSYSWPGNVRELEHLIERSVLLSSEHVLREIQLPKNQRERENDFSDHSNKTLKQLERTHIVKILKKCNGKVAGSGGAAEVLEIPSTTLHSKMKKLGISKGDYFLNQTIDVSTLRC